MKNNKTNKVGLIAVLLRAAVVLFLLLFFIAKPLIKRELDNSDNPIELCEESEENNEENETEKELEGEKEFSDFLIHNQLRLVVNETEISLFPLRNFAINPTVVDVLTPPPELI